MRGLEAHGDGPVAAAPELLAPVVVASGLLGQVAVEVVHEGGELGCIAGTEEQVVVVAEEDEGTDPHGVEAGGPGQDAADDCVELGRGTQQEPALEGAAVGRQSGDPGAERCCRLI